MKISLSSNNKQLITLHLPSIFLASFIPLCIPVSLAHAGMTADSLPVSASVTQSNILYMPGLEEPLVALGKPDPDETEAMKQALGIYFKSGKYADLGAITQFIETHPDSAWRVALQTNLGLIHYRNGAFSAAIDSWEDAWSKGKSATGVEEKAMVDRAYGELARMHARVGHADRIAQLLEEGKGRPLVGPATEAVAGAKEGLWMMRNDPGVSFLCGPAALGNVLREIDPNDPRIAQLEKERSGTHGFSLVQVSDLAKQLNIPYHMVKRVNNAPVPFPSVVHWKVNHYAAVLGFENNSYHVRDRIFGQDLWIPAEVFDKESDGYFLIPEGKVDTGWEKVAIAEGEKVYGMGFTGSSTPGRTTPGDNTNCDCSGNPPPPPGMPQYGVHSMLVSLNIRDRPVGYVSRSGLDMHTTITYNQREYYQPANFFYSNLGSKWTMNWIAYIQDDPGQPSATVKRVVAGGGGFEESTDTSFASTGEYKIQPQDGGLLVRVVSGSTSSCSLSGVAAGSYIRCLPDGSKEVYEYSDGATTAPRRFFLTRKIDSRKLAVTLSYQTVSSSQIRLTSVTDPLGKVTTFSYSDTAMPVKVTDITDPYGRSAHIGYDGSNRLNSITDAIGMTSTFTYLNTSDFVSSMTTPYGTTQFDAEETTDNYRVRKLVITDPQGNKERTEFRHDQGSAVTGLPNTDPLGPPGPDSTVYFLDNNYLNYRNTFYWDKHAYELYVKGRESSPDYSKAIIKHWVHEASSPTATTAGVLASIKKPNESRVWFRYPGQGPYTDQTAYTGTLEMPSSVARKLDDGSSQYTLISRDTFGKPQTYTMPDGVSFTYTYNGTNLASITRGSSTILTLQYNDSANPNLPTTATDPSGTTNYSYNSYGQIAQITNAVGQVTTYNYTGAELQNIVANGNTVAQFTYDSAGRIRTFKNAANYELTYDYDNLDRLTKITHPDASFVKYDYDKLDMVKVTDRDGSVMNTPYDTVRNLLMTSIPGVFQKDYKYYENGDVRYVIDGTNKVIANVVDDQSRVIQTQKGPSSAFTLTAAPSLNNAASHNTTITYENTNSRVKNIKDANQKITGYTYDVANRVKTVTDANSNTTTYNYYGPGVQNGPGLLDTVTSPDSGITKYTYYLSGNIQTKTKGYTSADAMTITYSWDALNRLTGIDYPSGAVDKDVTYVWDQEDTAHGSGKGHLTHVSDSSGTTDYKYNAAGQLVKKTEQPAGGIARITQYGYDVDGQLKTTTYPSGQVVTANRDGNFGHVSDVSLGANNLLSFVEYQPFGGLNNWTTASNVNAGWGGYNQYQRHYDLSGRISSWNLVSHNAIAYEHVLSYDDYGNISGIQVPADSTQNETYGYDAVSRLTDVTAQYGMLHYQYDNVGNRTYQQLKTLDPATQQWVEVFNDIYSIHSTSNKLLSVTRSKGTTVQRTREFSYDGRGNMLEDRRKIYPNGASYPVSSDKSLKPVHGNSDRMDSINYTNNLP